MNAATLQAAGTATAQKLRRGLLIALALSVVAVLVLYRGTFASMADKWNDDAAFGYGFTIAPLALWLAWRRREWLKLAIFEPSWLGALGAIGGAALWVVAKGAGVLVVEQFAAVLMLQSLVLATLGWRAVRALLFPLIFLVFLVPFGRGLVPWLVDITATIAAQLLAWSGVPVYRTHTLITIPGGWFEVAVACSGVAFLMTALVLGALYAELNFSSWKKRVVAVALAGGIPVLANAVRVYITIGVSHLTDMRFGPGAEHVRFGEVFFIAIMLATFWVGRRWHDPDTGAMPGWISSSGASARIPSLVYLIPLAGALIVLSLAPWYQASFERQLGAQLNGIASSVVVPADGIESSWSPLPSTSDAWRPSYHDALVERQGSFVDASDERVDVYVAVFGLGASAGAEMISYNQVLFPDEKAAVPASTRREVELPGNRRLPVREVQVPDGRQDRLVWQWYAVGDRVTTSPYVVKAFEGIAWITRRASHERVVTLATRQDEGARGRLESFVRAYADCVGSSFDAKDCEQ